MAVRKDKPGETSDQAEARRLEQNIRKKLSREKAKGLLPGTGDQSLAERKAMLEVTSKWKINYGQLPKDEKAKLDAHIRRWDDLIKLMNIAIDALSLPEMSEEDWEFVRLVAVDVDAFVAEYPATSDPLYQAIQNAGVEQMEYAPLQEKLKATPTMLRLYGLACDHVHTPCYKHFVWAIRERQRKDRMAAEKVKQPVPELPPTYEQNLAAAWKDHLDIADGKP